MPDFNVYWGDFHKHLEDLDNAETLMQSARGNLDFYPVLEYPFYWYDVGGGLRIESVRNRPRFLEMWETLRELAMRYNEPGRFTTFLGYEWNGNRTRWGDHNVIWFDPAEGELLDTWDLPELYEQLRGRRVLALPHHTAYARQWRGKDWDCWDPELSPVMEIYSSHGSSEGCRTPVPMLRNEDMGPRFPGGSFQDALARGHRIGTIASNDGTGLAGSWDNGVAAVLAMENTRESLWEAVRARRTYGTTGERIGLRFWVNGTFMGGEAVARGSVRANVQVECCQALDRVELIQNGRVVATHCHQEVHPKNPAGEPAKILIDCGWGPAQYFGWPKEENIFEGTATVSNGSFTGLHPRLRIPGQQLELLDAQTCRWRFAQTSRGARRSLNWQGLILCIDRAADAVLDVQVNGRRLSAPVVKLLQDGIYHCFTDEAKEQVQKHFGVDPEEVENPDTFFHHAQKVKVHRAVPESSYKADVTFADLDLAPGANSFYTRVTQVDGQTAWSSPVWILNQD